MATYYVRTDGVDDEARNGLTTGAAWATPSYAASRVVTSGNTIYIDSGTYYDDDRVVLMPRIHLQGNSSTPPTIITEYVAGSSGDAYLYLYNSSLTDGSQTISYINFDGNSLTADRAIIVYHRYNVSIHHCSIVDFSATGCHFRHQIDWMTPPSTYATGNSFYNNTVNNCSDRAYSSIDPDNLRIDGQQEMVVYNCTFDNTSRTAGENGNIFAISNSRDIKIYDCTFTKNDYEGGEWNFFAEIFHIKGGVEIYNCEFIGCAVLDFSNAHNGVSESGAYDYTMSVHDNTFTTTDGTQTDESGMGHPPAAIVFEKGTYDTVYIYNNYILAYPFGIMYSTSTNNNNSLDGLYLYNNILENIGYTDDLYTWGISFLLENNSGYSVTLNNINIWNNVINGGSGNNYNGIRWVANGTATNVNIQNNIITGWDQYAVHFSIQGGESASVTNIDVTYNCFYGNGTNGVYVDGSISETNEDYSTGNITTNPDYDGDFKIDDGSPCYHEGIDVGLDTDFAGVAWYDPPSMGAYEYSTAVAPTVTTAAVTSISDSGGTGGGNVTSDGGASVTDRGVCWSTSANPTTADSHVHSGSGTGTFTGAISGCENGTLYHVRAFAINSEGTSYGSDVTFTTDPDPYVPPEYGTKYQVQFMDDLEVLWKVQFQYDDYAGAVTEFTASGEPLGFEWYGEDDILKQRIMGSAMTVRFEMPNDFTYTDLFAANNLEVKTLVYKDTALVWSGFVQANNYQEPYDEPPFTAAVTAVDGLGILKDFDFSALGYTDRETIATVIYDILGLVGIKEFKEYVNLYESGMTSLTSSTMMNQCAIDPDLFEEMTCYDALDAILKTLNAGIRQNQGVIEIFRFIELKSTTLYGRSFTTVSTIASISKTPLQKINRTGDASNFADREGGTLMIMPQYKSINVSQDYGNKESWIDNWQFKSNTLSGDSFNDWTNSTSGVLVGPMQDLVAGEKEGCLIVSTETYPAHTKYIYQQFGTYGVATTGDFGFEFEYLFFNNGISQVDDNAFYIEISDVAGNYWLDDAIESPLGHVYQMAPAWAESQEYIIVTNDAPVGITDWQTVKLLVPGLPIAGPYVIKIFSMNTLANSIYVAIKNVKFYAYSHEVTLKTEMKSGVDLLNAVRKSEAPYRFLSTIRTTVINEFTVSVSTNGQIIDMDFILGDGDATTLDILNVVEQFAGALSTETGTATSSSWATRGNTENMPIVTLVANEIMLQYAVSKQVVDLPVRETSASAFLDINGTLADSLNSNKKFAIARASFDVKHREWELTLTELI